MTDVAAAIVRLRAASVRPDLDQEPGFASVWRADLVAILDELAQHAALVAAGREYVEACAAYKRATLAVREAEGTDHMFDRDLAIAWDETGKAYSAAHDVLCNAALVVQPAESEAGRTTADNSALWNQQRQALKNIAGWNLEDSAGQYEDAQIAYSMRHLARSVLSGNNGDAHD